MITISLPIPDRKLSLNGREHWRTVAKLRADQHEVAQFTGAAAMMKAPQPWPLYSTTNLSVSIDVERKTPRARGQSKVWDAAAMIEATKGYLDGLNGITYTDDTQIREFRVRWDAKPTGNGLIHLYIRALSEPQGWPVVAWATEEWR
jgi:Holliday junction resolvase RusA-like endonuclease